ncbi:MAG: tRNA (adenosine(37)-N6)-threonylcarbamoyltransferase complex ATPase subunit type 1 TsaE [Selenomonadaceae bacterium]|nr:tRNA (adenosine(37)-N6)-threonylcarbamoyltransferase complex ATPase subunit type 1 TsaE [Selenomonadaceae bacterium]
MFTNITQSPYETVKLASKVAQRIREGTVVCLEGNLGAGKTLFVQSMARTLGVQGEVTSPTFNLMNIYEGFCPIVHFDLYRLQDEEELEEIGFYEYTDFPEGIVFIEWGEKFPESLPDDYFRIEIERIKETRNMRRITFSCVGEEHLDFLKELEEFVTRED